MADEDQNVYYTHVPDWAGEQIEEYRQEHDLTKSKACSKIIQRGLTGPDDTTRLEQIARRVEELAWTSAIVISVIWTFATVGQIVGLITPASQAVGEAVLIVTGPSFVLTAIIARRLLSKGYLRKIERQLADLPSPDKIAN